VGREDEREGYSLYACENVDNYGDPYNTYTLQLSSLAWEILGSSPLDFRK
jgi:hypothetical protein